MAKRISEKEVASVRLLALELSEDEITVLASALTSLLQECDDNEIGSVPFSVKGGCGIL
jgi:hypothetical protein